MAKEGNLSHPFYKNAQPLLEKESSVRLAVYDSPTTSPRVIELSSSNCLEFIHLLATKTYEASQSKGGKLPYIIIKELVENLIHAYFRDAIITVLDDGNTIRISDRGPGIKNKEKAFLPGFSTANAQIKEYIKGVGSGLPIVKEALSYIGGAITIEDNLSQGTVITLSLGAASPRDTGGEQKEESRKKRKPLPSLTDRQKRVLLLIMELSLAGPSIVAKELNISLSTAHRDMAYLEKIDLLRCDENGKRSLTEEGLMQIDLILK